MVLSGPLVLMEPDTDGGDSSWGECLSTIVASPLLPGIVGGTSVSV